MVQEQAYKSSWRITGLIRAYHGRDTPTPYACKEHKHAPTAFGSIRKWHIVLQTVRYMPLQVFLYRHLVFFSAHLRCITTNKNTLTQDKIVILHNLK